jgi:hypothetical protein
MRPVRRRRPESSRALQPGAASWRSYGITEAVMGGTVMRTILSKTTNVLPNDSAKNPLQGELLDLYMANLIVIPVALFLKSLWS